MKTTRQILVAMLLAASAFGAQAGDYSNNPEAQAFVKQFSTQYGWPIEQVAAIIDQARRKDSIIKAMARPAEKIEPWYVYRRRVNRARIMDGARFWENNRAILERVQTKLGVDPAVVVAIIGFETRYGRITGKHPVLDALATLSFDYPDTPSKARREKFFQSELAQFLLLSREEHIDPLNAKGSYAGAMGYGQFMPSSYRQYAVDFDGDGHRDLWNSKDDIIASVANYLKQRGKWQPGEPVAVPASVTGTAYRELLDKGSRPSIPVSELGRYGVTIEKPVAPDLPAALIELDGEKGPEYWVTFNNFYAIFSYNPRNKYAMAVHQLAAGIEKEMRVVEEEE